MRYQEFFSALVHLLYGVSKSDHEVHLLEVQNILDIIHEDIPKIFPQIVKSFQPLNSKLAIEEFRHLYTNQVNEEDAYSVFIQFYKKHRNEFNLDLNLLCYQLALKVARTNKDINEEEMNFLVRLKQDLEVD